jgi:crotonobetainyl-CoA:carnitine CoA-transferase CaiB-like acyl-CoA transferase
VVAALYRRSITGEGCFLDAAGSDGVLATGWIAAVYGWNESRLTDRRDLRPRGAPAYQSAKYQWYRTADEQYVLFCCIEHKFWSAFCAGIGRPEWASVPDSDGPVDFSHGDRSLRVELQSVFATRTQAEWIEFAIEHDLPIGPSHQTVLPLRSDPHLLERNIIVEGSHPTAGEFTYIGEPVIVDEAPYVVRLPAPRLGEHTDEVLASLGYSRERIETLRADGVV